jgi:hypothetical protein
MLNLKLELEAAGIKVANAHHSVLLASNLFNHLTQSKLVQRKWPQLETIMKVQLKNMFFGELPVTAEKAYRIFVLRYGRRLADVLKIGRNKENASNFALGAEYEDRPGRVNPACLLSTNMSGPLVAFMGGQETLRRTIHVLRLQSEKDQGPQRKSRSYQRAPPIDIVKVVDSMQPWFQEKMSEASIDYISAVRTCEDFLVSLVKSKMISSHLNRGPKSQNAELDKDAPGWSRLMDIFEVVHAVIADANDRVHPSDKAAEMKFKLTKPQAEIAAPLVLKWLDENVKEDR